MLLYVNEISERLRVSRLTVYKLMNESGLAEHMLKIGGQYCIDESDLNAWLTKQKLIKNEAQV